MNHVGTSVLRQRIDSFSEQQEKLSPAQAELALVEVLRSLFAADGYTLEHTGGLNVGAVDYRARRGQADSADALTTIVEVQAL